LPGFRVAAILGVTTLLALVLTGTANALPEQDVSDIGVDTGRFSLPTNCAITLPDFGGVKVLDLGTTVDVQGAVAAQLGRGQEFWLTEGSGSITFPEALTALAGVVGINKADATISALNIGAENATPAQHNVTDPPAEIKDIPIQAGQPLKVGLPLEGTFDVGPFTAPDSGTVTLHFVDAVVHVALRSAIGFTLNVDANCTPTAGNALLTIAVARHGQRPARRRRAHRVRTGHHAEPGGRGRHTRVQNVAAGGIDIPETTLVRDRKVVLSLPQNGTLTAGPAAGRPSVPPARRPLRRSSWSTTR
jgi:DNA mismatch repair protein MutH